MKFFLSINDYREHKAINENMNVAKSFLASKNIPLDDPDFLVIKNDILSNNLGYLGLFTKLHYGDEKVSLFNLDKLMTWIQQNKLALKDFSKDLVLFDKYEDITDEINIIETIQSVKPIIQQLPQKVRAAWMAQDRNSRYTQALLIKSLSKEDVQSLIRKSSRYINLPFEEFVKGIKILVDRASSGHSYEEILKSIKDTPGATLTYSNEGTGVIVASIKTHAASHKLGSPSWCISYSDSSHFDTNYMEPSKMNTQYFVWCTALPVSDLLSMVGLTINKDGKLTNIHNKADNDISSRLHEFYTVSGLSIDNFKPLNYEKVLKGLESFKHISTIDDIFKNYSTLKDFDEFELKALVKNLPLIKTILYNIFSIDKITFEDSLESIEAKLDNFIKQFNLFADKYEKLLPLILPSESESAWQQLCKYYFEGVFTTFIIEDEHQGLINAYNTFKNKFNNTEKYDEYILPVFRGYILKEFSNKKLKSSDVHTIDNYISIYENTIQPISKILIKTSPNMVNNAFLENKLDFWKYLIQLTEAKSKELVDNLTIASVYDKIIIRQLESNEDSLPNSLDKLLEMFKQYPCLIDIFKTGNHEELSLFLCKNLSIASLSYLQSNDESPVKNSFDAVFWRTIVYDKVDNFNEFNSYLEINNISDYSKTIEAFESGLYTFNKRTLMSNIIQFSAHYIFKLVNEDEMSVDDFFEKYPFITDLLNNSACREMFLGFFKSDKKIQFLNHSGVDTLQLKEDKVYSYIKNISAFNAFLEYFKEKNLLNEYLVYISGNAANYTAQLAFEILEAMRPYENEHGLLAFFDIDEVIVNNLGNEPNFEFILNGLSETPELVKKIDLEYVYSESNFDYTETQKSMNTLIENFEVPGVNYYLKALSFINAGRYSSEFLEEVTDKGSSYLERDNMCFIYDSYHDSNLGFFYDDGEPIEEDYISRFESHFTYDWYDYKREISPANKQFMLNILEENGYDITVGLDRILSEEGDDEEINPGNSNEHDEIMSSLEETINRAHESANADAYYEKLTDALTKKFFTGGYKFVDDKLVLMMSLKKFKEILRSEYTSLVKEANGEFTANDIINFYGENNGDAIDKDINVDATMDEKYFNEELSYKLSEIASEEVKAKFKAYKESEA